MGTSRTRPAVSALLLVVGAALAGCVATPPSPPPCGAVSVAPLAACDQQPTIEIASAVVSQSQALPDFDTSRYLVEDPAQLDRLEAILNPMHPVEATQCPPGSRTTVVEVEPVDADPFVLTTSTCTGDATSEALDALVLEWRESGTFPVAP
ncbi:hypothetical protein [Agrococcus sp. SGAir0287]|uniref:hypothetical protein n=1 Tax=Agrococcus sp. SGAir0287 TaxID=2070347 RepID=UPI0010CCBC33|nr:hypothetical protein [Agrococcus sp. SGAir0287]QCR18606.1 hypothetical protein C1N71_03360 [Agrococcus sp. SGAir0287]